MDLSNSSADSVRRPLRGRLLRRLVTLLALGVLVGTFGARAAFAADGVQLTLSTNAAAPGSTVTLTATVTSSLGVPSGTVSFTNVAVSPAVTLDNVNGETLIPTGANTASVSFPISSLAVGSYTIQANYTPDLTAFLIGITGNLTSPSEALTIASNPAPPTTYPTQVTLSAPSSVVSTAPVTLTATVARTSGPAGTPTGTVDFIDTISGSSVPLGSKSLVDGVATLDLSSLSAGPHTIQAIYDGDANDNGSNSLPSSVDSQAPADTRLQTTSAVTTSPSQIAVGDTVTILATITQSVQVGGQAPQPPGGSVTFTTDSSCGNNVLLGSVPLGQGPDGITVAANQAALQTSTLQACSYTVTASYTGDVYDQTSSATTPLVVLPPRTATAVEYTGDTTVEYGQTATFSATVTDLGSGAALAGRTVTFMLGAQQCSGTTDGSGVASCSFAVTEDVPGGTVTTTVARDAQTDGGSVDTPFAVTQQPTSLTTAYQIGAAATLTGTLSGDLGQLPGQTITLGLGGATCTATTLADGTGSCTVAVPAGPTATLTGSFAGTTDYSASTATSRDVPIAAPTTTVAAAPTVGATSTALSATLTSGGLPVAGRTLTLTFGTASCTAQTSASGAATCSVPTPTGASATFTASFAGDAAYAPSSDSRTVALLSSSTITYLGETGDEYADPALLAARVTVDGRIVPNGEPVTFTLGTQTCTGRTFFGYAFCVITLAQPAGAYTVTAAYGGDATYGAATTTAPFTIKHEEAVVAVSAGPALAGSSTTLGATLLEDGARPIAGRTVTLSLGGRSCTAVTKSSGAASCSLTAPSLLGPTTATASFAGDAYYSADSDSTQSIVYAYAPGGAFVIGDRSTSGTVTFWGSQWAKDNDLSGGSAPSAFKGFAIHGTTQCGSSWSTDPGNSSPPPSGPLPTYMAVLVTSGASKSGSTISGNTVSIVVVKTNSGYAPNPGHAGTGTVVATVCGPSNDSHGSDSHGWDDEHGDWGDDRRDSHGCGR